MKIPKSFYIFNQRIVVKWKRDLHTKQKAIGLWIPVMNQIHLQLSTKAYPITGEQQMQCFHHELMHCMLDILGYEELSRNEKLVDRLGNSLHQVLESAEY
jgi:hypothetical protein